MARASAETRTTALLFSFSAVVLVLLALQPPDRRPGGGGALADLLLAAFDRFPDARGLLDLATRRNMVLLSHAILLLILRDAGVLGSPARRRAATESTASVAAAADAAAPLLTDAAEPERSIVVWRRPRGSGAEQDAHADGSGRRPVRRRQPRRSPRQPAAAALAAEEPEQQQPPVLSEEIALVEEVPGNYLLLLDDHDRNRNDRNASTVSTEQTEAAVELADDRKIEEFITRQRSQMWQESLQVERSSPWSQS